MARTPRSPEPAHDKVRRHRARLREQGLRPLQVWVPDTRTPGFSDEARRQSLAVAGSGHAASPRIALDALRIAVRGQPRSRQRRLRAIVSNVS